MIDSKKLRSQLAGTGFLLGWLFFSLAFLGQSDICQAEADAAVLYTSPSVTTPQLPFFAARAAGRLDSVFKLKIEYWKDPESLQTLVLAGKGDLWIGHIEGFARARAKGAPVTLVAVTGWRKFYLLSSRLDVLTPEALSGKNLPYTPAGSPSVPVLRAILGQSADKVNFSAEEPKQLAMKLLAGTYDTALVPEPIVSSILAKNPALKVIWSLEDEFAERFGGNPRLPLAGIAVNTNYLSSHPAAVERLLSGMKAGAEDLKTRPENACEVMPAEFSEFVPCQMLQASLKRDIIQVEKASEVQAEIMRYISLVAPELSAGSLGAGFFWQAGQNVK